MGSVQTEGRTALADARRAGIEEMLRLAGSVSVAEVEARFGVSSMTARRDLAQLERQGVARRTHGGAVLPSITSHEDSFGSRLKQAAAAKHRLGAAAAALVGDGESVFLDSSSTAYCAAGALLQRGIRATVITNSQPIMELICAHPNGGVELVGIGGTLRRLTRSFVGPVATAAVQAHFADRLFFSVKGLGRDGVLTDADPLEAEVKRSMVEHADDVVLLVDRSKVGSRGLSLVGELALVSRVLAADVDGADVAALEALGVRVQPVREEDG